MGAVPYVGATALDKLRAHAFVWWTAMRGTPTLAGSFDGVAFDDATARIALDIANHATYIEMSQHGVPGTGAAPIVGNRPYTKVAQVAAVSGVGPATMSALKAYAQSGQWGNPAACVTRFDDAVGPRCRSCCS